MQRTLNKRTPKQLLESVERITKQHLREVAPDTMRLEVALEAFSRDALSRARRIVATKQLLKERSGDPLKLLGALVTDLAKLNADSVALAGVSKDTLIVSHWTLVGLGGELEVDHV